MAEQHPGILAIWNDCRAGREAEFEAWFQGEHLMERLAIPGFLLGRRHQAISGSAGYFNFYLVESPDVLTSTPYLERLDDPTPMTKRIMSEVFLNMNRTVCRRTMRYGGFRGAYAVTARFDVAPDESALKATLHALVADTAVASGEVWIALDPRGMPVSQEEKLRGGDRKSEDCLIIFMNDTATTERPGADLARKFPAAEVGVFRVLCQLGRETGA